MMSFKLSIRCHRCFQLGFHPAQNWHPTAAARQTHVLKHLRHDYDAFEKEQDAQLLQNDQFEPIRDLCFPQQNQPETEDFQVYCAECGAVLAKKELVAHCLKKHLKKKPAEVKAGQRTPTKKEKRQCPKRKKTVSKLRRHQRVHSGERQFLCLHCGKGFKLSHHLKQHQRANHNMHDPFICEDCGKGFGLKTHVKRHMMTVHLKQKPFNCPQCNKCFGQKGTLKQHQAAVHQMEKPFSCGVCGQKLARKHDLLRHQEAIHGKQNPFLCHHCGKRFGRMSDLKVHKRLHTGEKPFQCRQCGKRFSNGSNKNRHEKNCSQEVGAA